MLKARIRLVAYAWQESVYLVYDHPVTFDTLYRVTFNSTSHQYDHQILCHRLLENCIYSRVLDCSAQNSEPCSALPMPYLLTWGDLKGNLKSFLVYLEIHVPDRVIPPVIIAASPPQLEVLPYNGLCQR